MTTICVYRTEDKIIIAGDSNYQEDGKNYQGQSKLIRFPDNNGLVTYCGNVRVGTLLAENYQHIADAISDAVCSMYEMASYFKELLEDDGMFDNESGSNTDDLRDFSILIIAGNEIWLFDAFFSVINLQDDFYSMGSGSSYAYGAYWGINSKVNEFTKLHLEDVMNIAAFNDSGTEGPFDFVTIENKRIFEDEKEG